MKKLIILTLILFMLTCVGVKAAPIYTENAVWIQDAGWPAMNQYILSSNLEKVLNDLSDNSIKYAFVMVGYYDGSSPTNSVLWQRTTTGGYMDGGPPNVTFYTSVVNALHSKNIKAIAWIEDTNAPHGINVSPSNWGNLEAQINYTLQWGFDGYNDDIESVNGTLQDQINWWNNVTVWLHSLGKLSMPDVGFDWQQNTNQYLHVDAIVSMFYSSRSTLEDVQAPYYWQEEFGEYEGHNTPPASPVILGLMNYYGNTYPLAWQLNQASKYLSLYGHPQLAGFSLWLYEYMGTNPDDWGQWNYWINRIGTSTPPLYIITFNSSPINGIQLSYDSTQVYTPANWYTFNGTTTVNAPYQVSRENHNVLFGDSDSTGGREGYDAYAYAGGPYNLTSSASVNSIYFYCAATGNVKLAIYNATYYYIDSWKGRVTSDGYDYHPYALLTQSSPTACLANSWVSISVPTITLPAGIYFIVVKGDTTGIIGVSGLAPQVVGGNTYGYDQFITESYGTAFKQTFPTVEGAMGNEPSAYVPTAPFTLTQYNFAHWEDGSTDPNRAISLSSNATITASYTTTSTLNKISGALKDKNNQPVQAKIIAYQSGTSNVINSATTDSNGNYNLSVSSGVYDVQFNLTNFFISNYAIKVLNLNIANDTYDVIKQITGNSTTNKVSFVIDVNNTQTVNVYSDISPENVKKNGTILASAPSLTGLANDTWFYNPSEKKIYIKFNSIYTITANSGSVKDIQAAVNAAAAAGGGNVYIPPGNFTFNLFDGTTGNAGTRIGVTVPGGVNVFGAGNNQTILYVPINAWRSGGEALYADIMFKLNGANNKSIRISDIVFQGSINYTAGAGENSNLAAISENGVRNFRIDHCMFIDFDNTAIGCSNNFVNPSGNSGVIDHCVIDNPYKDVYWNYTGQYPIWAYGIIVGGDSQAAINWYPLDSRLGQYGPDIVYIEDNSFRRCRHDIAGVGSGSGGWYVARHNYFTDNILAHLGSFVDNHGGGRGFEVYDNTFVDVPMDYRSLSDHWGQYLNRGVNPRGGSGVIFNNNIIKCGTGVVLSNDQNKSSTWRLHDFWVWNNTFVNVTNNFTTSTGVVNFDDGFNYTMTQNIDYFLRAPNQAQDGFTYTPYPYPHPLTQNS